MSLTAKQRAFVDHYVQSWNATDAAKRAGYSERTAHVIGHENLRKPKIQTEIDKAVQSRVITRNEALARLADQVRGDLGDYIDDSGKVDIQKAKREGKTHLIRKFKKKGDDIEIQLVDDQKALFKMLDILGITPESQGQQAEAENDWWDAIDDEG